MGAVQENPIDEKAIYQIAIAIDSDEVRRNYLHQVCGRDTSLLRRVAMLLRMQDEAPEFLESPPVPIPTIEMPPVVEKPGTKIGPYKLREQIGEGGFGVVYVAQQSKPVRRNVALKIIKPGMDTKEVIARFEAERQALALMDHSNIAKVLDAGATDSGRPFFVMELVRGVPITEFCDEQKLSTRERLHLFIDICRAIQHAHQKGIIHRDLKPSNIMVTLDDNRPMPKVIDFGISKALSQQLTENSVYTAYGQMIGTPLYMAPEQAQMSMRDVDTRSDVYSLGVLLYELLTGTTPFDKRTLEKSGYEEMRRIICEMEPPRPSARISTLNAEALSTVSDRRKVDSRKLSQSLRGELDWIVMKALEKDRNRRYESASAFAVDVERYLSDEPVQACPPSVVYRFGKFARRKKAALAAFVVALIFISTIAGGIGWMTRDRAARQTRTITQVNDILDNVDELMVARKWSEALEAAKRAQAILKTGDTDAETRFRVNRVLDDLRLVQRLEQALYVNQTVNGDWNWAVSDQAYTRAFTEAGLNIEKCSVKKAVDQLQPHSAIKICVASALTEWAVVRRAIHNGTDDKRWQHLITVADAIDPDPWRHRLRRAWKTKDKNSSMIAVRALAKRTDLRQLPLSSLRLLARTLKESTTPDEAVQILRIAQQQHPDDFDTNYRLAACLGASTPKRLDEALIYFHVALGLRPGHPLVLNSLGWVLHNQKKLDEAIAYYRRAIDRAPSFGLAYSNIGEVFAAKGKRDEAIMYYRKAVECNASHFRPYLMLGDALTMKGQLVEAVSVYRTGIKHDPTSADLYCNLGNVFVRQRKFEEAIASYRNAIKLDPKSACFSSNLGAALEKSGQLDKGIAAARNAISLDPKYAPAHSCLGVCLFKKGMAEKAVSCFRKAIELDRNNAGFHYLLGTVLMRRKEYTQAIHSLRESIRLDPNKTDAHLNLGNCFLNQGDFEKAKTCYRDAIKTNPRNTGARNNLGYLLLRMGGLDEAVIHLRKAIEIEPDVIDWNRYFTLGLAFAAKKDWKNYRQHCAVLVGRACRQPKSKLRPLQLAWCCKLGPVDHSDRTTVIDLLREQVSKTPNHLRLKHELACALYRAGHYSDALPLFRHRIAALTKKKAAPAHDVLWLSMTQQRLGQRENARTSLQIGKRYTKTLSNRNLHWRVRLELKLLQEEAQQLVKGKPAVAPRPDKQRSQPKSHVKN